MAEPLSTTASIIAVVGFAAESSKLAIELFRKLARTPANVHDSLLALTTLHLTLNNLQDCGSKHEVFDSSIAAPSLNTRPSIEGSFFVFEL